MLVTLELPAHLGAVLARSSVVGVGKACDEAGMNALDMAAEVAARVGAALVNRRTDEPLSDKDGICPSTIPLPL